MSWFRADDKLQKHRKWVAIDHVCDEKFPRNPDKARRLARDAKLLWYVAGNWGAGNNCDGIIPRAAARQIAAEGSMTFEEVLAAAQVLVDVGFWHALPKKRGGPGWEIHDWHDYQPSRQQVQRTDEREKRRKDLYRTVEGRRLIAAVRDRDGDECQYCGVEVKWEDRRSAQGGTYDHIDADGENTLDNLVVACRHCNRAKADRTPEEAGMPLRHDPRRERAA